MNGFQDVVSAIGAGSPYAGLGLVLVVLLRLWARAEARAEAADKRTAEVRKELQEAHAAEVLRITKAHDDEIGELRRDVAELRTAVDRLHREVDSERTKRREAEDREAAANRRAKGGA